MREGHTRATENAELVPDVAAWYSPTISPLGFFPFCLYTTQEDIKVVIFIKVLRGV